MKQVECDETERNGTLHRLGDTATLAEELFDETDGQPDGVLDVVPAFGTTAVHFDAALTTGEAVSQWLSSPTTESPSVESRGVVEVPVVYGGAEGSDLESLALRAGLTIDQAIRLHSGTDYTVGAVGFQPGFPYLEGLPPELHTSRRETPRTRVPAGSVGIGGPYTGVYPSESPGGWNLLGRTPLTLFDAYRAEPSLLRVGDRVRFRPIDTQEFARLAVEHGPAPVPVSPPLERPLFRVLRPGVQSTVQGLGRYGQQHLGVSPGGAMDFASLRLANLLIENDPDASTIEATLVGPVLECLEPVTVGIAGAVERTGCRRFARGERLDLRKLPGGARAYLALPGGVASDIGIGLKEGDLVGSSATDAVDRVNARPVLGHTLGRVGRRTAEPPTLQIMRGPQADTFDDTAWQRLLGEAYRVSAQSNRMGIRCEGSVLPCPDAGDLPSQPVCHGVIQVPPNGQPIVLGADRQTLGGYPVIAAVVSADWPRLGQLRPSDTVRFAKIDLPEAIRLRKQVERELAIASVGIQTRGN